MPDSLETASFDSQGHFASCVKGRKNIRYKLIFFTNVSNIALSGKSNTIFSPKYNIGKKKKPVIKYSKVQEHQNVHSFLKSGFMGANG